MLQDKTVFYFDGEKETSTGNEEIEKEETKEEEEDEEEEETEE